MKGFSEEPQISAECFAKLIETLNERPSYTVQEMCVFCRALTGRIVAEDSPPVQELTS